MNDHVLLIDDDELMCLGLRLNQQHSGCRVSTATNAEEGLRLARSEAPDIVLLDIGLPGMSGLDALRQFKALSDTPVVFVSAHRLPHEQAFGLDLGADDYVTKPFELDVLLARLKAILRRTRHSKEGASASTEMVVGDLVLNVVSQHARLKDRPLGLTPLEFRLLYALASQPGRTYSVDELLARVWGQVYAGEPQVIYVHIRALREKIEETPSRHRRVVSVRGFGYKYQLQENQNARCCARGGLIGA